MGRQRGALGTHSRPHAAAQRCPHPAIPHPPDPELWPLQSFIRCLIVRPGTCSAAVSVTSQSQQFARSLRHPPPPPPLYHRIPRPRPPGLPGCANARTAPALHAPLPPRWTPLVLMCRGAAAGCARHALPSARCRPALPPPCHPTIPPDPELWPLQSFIRCLIVRPGTCSAAVSVTSQSVASATSHPPDPELWPLQSFIHCLIVRPGTCSAAVSVTSQSQSAVCPQGWFRPLPPWAQGRGPPLTSGPPPGLPPQA